MPRVKFGPAQPDWSSGAVLDREWLAEPLLQSLGGQSPWSRQRLLGPYVTPFRCLTNSFLPSGKLSHHDPIVLARSICIGETIFLGPEERPKSHSGQKRSPRRRKRSRKSPRASAMNWQEPAGITAPMVRPVPKRFGVDAR
jgi:hypothetical protein